MEDDELQAATARGRATREQREASQQDEGSFSAAARAAADQRDRERRLGWSVSWAGAFQSPLGWLYLFFLWAGSTMAMVVLLELVGTSAELLHVLLPGHNRVFPIPTTVAVFGFWLWTRGAPARALARERAWLKSLPFTLSGYEEALGDKPSQNEKPLELRFVFAAEPPAQQLLDLLSGDGGAWSLSPRTGNPLRDPGIGKQSWDHNRPVHRWFHQLVEQQLLPLHRAHPFTALELINRH